MTPNQDSLDHVQRRSAGPQQKDLIRFVKPGEVYIAIKHHSPMHPELVGNDKEAIKFQATHIEIVVGVEVEVDGKMVPGVITLNNPQATKTVSFGSPDYPLILTRLTFPKDLSPRKSATM